MGNAKIDVYQIEKKYSIVISISYSKRPAVRADVVACQFMLGARLAYSSY